MAPKILSVETDAVLPGRADVVIVGGGIIGLTTAMHLAEAGISCVVCEKGVLAGEQSSRNAGWVRQQGRDVREVELSIVIVLAGVGHECSGEMLAAAGRFVGVIS